MQTKFGAIIVEGRGKTNGHVATKNRNGNALRTKIKPANKRSVDQMHQRANFAAIAGKWNSLTVEQIMAWNAAAENAFYSNAFGDKKKYTGRALFQKINLNILLGNGTMITTPQPSSPVPGAEIEVEQYHANDVNICWNADNPLPVGTVVVLSATPILRNGQTFLKGKYRVIAFANYSEGECNITTSYPAKFGPLAAGNHFSVQLKIINVNTGDCSIPTSAICEIV